MSADDFFWHYTASQKVRAAEQNTLLLAVATGMGGKGVQDIYSENIRIMTGGQKLRRTHDATLAQLGFADEQKRVDNAR